jgi:hypothetical protein
MHKIPHFGAGDVIKRMLIVSKIIKHAFFLTVQLCMIPLLLNQ